MQAQLSTTQALSRAHNLWTSVKDKVELSVLPGVTLLPPPPRVHLPPRIRTIAETGDALEYHWQKRGDSLAEPRTARMAFLTVVACSLFMLASKNTLFKSILAKLKHKTAAASCFKTRIYMSVSSLFFIAFVIVVLSKRRTLTLDDGMTRVLASRQEAPRRARLWKEFTCE